MSHFIHKCSCGAVISQCRCPSSSKAETIIDRGCGKCHGSTVSLSRVQPIKIVHGQPTPPITNRNWRIEKDGAYIEVTPEDLQYLHKEIYEIFYSDD